eukprot:TRINITY_DN12397_c3_g1_i13.p1 TRINITY_DN12397_c3_g1~~TRINITY_DN12397_c3_g1_i13.p1  ORF type:complete len:666 (+),score=216.25 TRINITY_DN12397_c3_g1_i13:108-2000(+)
MFKSLRGKKSAKPAKKELKKLQQAVPKRIWEAENNPDKTGDFSGCGLEDVGAAIVTACKRKETLLLYGNYLEKLPPALGRLTQLVVLDLHNNFIKALPDELGCLTGLKILNLEHNHLDRLPSTLAKLQLLDTLNLQDNAISDMTPLMALTSLRTLNLRNNQVLAVPGQLSELKLLDTLQLEGNPVENIPADVIAQGTASIMKLLCQRCGVEYKPPSHFAAQAVADSSHQHSDTLAQYRREEEERVQRMLESASKREAERTQAQSSAMAALKEQELRQQQLLQQQREQRAAAAKELQAQEVALTSQRLKLNDAAAEDRLAVLARLKAEAEEEDQRARAVVAQWEATRTDPSRMAALLQQQDQLERTFIAAEIARQASQQAALDAQHEQAAQMTTLAQGATLAKTELRQQALAQLASHQAAVDQALSGYLDQVEQHRAELSDARIAQERKEMTLAAGATADQQQRQVERQREIRALEAKMAELSASVVATQTANDATKQAVVEQQRAETERRLASLQEEQERQLALRERALIELNEAEQRNSRAYWEAKLQASLSQLQALNGGQLVCDPVTQSLLIGCGCGELVPLFASQRVDAVVLRILTEQDLIQMGVDKLGDRKRILTAVSELFAIKAA